MNATEVPVFDVFLPRNDPIQDEKWHREDFAFRMLFPQLMNDYPEEYVAIHEGRVVGHGTDKTKVAIEAYRDHGNVAILVRKVSKDPPPIVRIPTFQTL